MEEERSVNYYKDYEAKDFALDSYFIDWVKNPSEEQNMFWAAYSSTYPGKEKDIHTARSLVQALQFDSHLVSSKELEKSWTEIRGKLASQKTTGGREKRSGYGPYLRVAALLMLVLSAVIALNVFDPNPLVKPGIAEVSKVTLKGQKLTVVLPDKSIVKLNSESRITYPERFAENERSVTLQGEAFFEVTHNPERPFKVHTGSISTIVKGTSFNVHVHPESSSVQVALLEGSVIVKNDLNQKEEVELHPGEMVTLESDGRFNAVTPFEYSSVLGWKDGQLNLNTVSFPQALELIEYWYGVEFIIDENVVIDPQWRFHGKFKNKSLGYVLRAMSYPELFEFKITGEKVLIYKPLK